MKRFARASAVLAIVVLVVGLLTSAASAAPVTNSDRSGDGHGPGDILAVRLSYQGIAVQIRVRTAEPLNLATAAAWHRNGSRSLLQLDLSTSEMTSGREATIFLRPTPGALAPQLVSEAMSPAPRGLCEAPTVSQPQPTMIQISVSILCLPGNDGGVRASARYRFDRGGDGTSNSDDRAPAAGFGKRLLIGS